jgi:hypothetical protein
MDPLRNALMIFALTLLTSCGEKPRDNGTLTSELEPEMEFDSMAYDSMRVYYNSDTAFVSMLLSRVHAGDTNALKVKRLLNTPYSSRNSTGLNDSEIGSMVFAYRSSKKVIDRFTEIESALPKNDPDSLRMSTDSIIRSLEELKKDLKVN